ncbi:dTMP kinase [Kitasatospora sp. CB02891]|uniref:dTMP kinase n=1 Tax=Kitasatospora sp. CB02891 TaxID=2020329 RepID=UPI000C27006F|nr:dTMP kinase [Kitasatospora sp. CB02891]PJN24396.1 dTMP kinase [Kitasatospora sp. CB02891]
MYPPFLPVPLPFKALQRILLVALLIPLLLITVAAAVPALVLMPFLPGGVDRTVRLLHAHTSQIRTVLTGSRAAPDLRPRRTGRP